MSGRTVPCFPTWFFLMFGCSSSQPSTSAAPAAARVTVLKNGVQRLGAADGSPRVNRPYFDAQGGLRWDDSPLDATPACPPGTPPAQRERLMLSPAVDRLRCAGGKGAKASVLLLGIDGAGKAMWQRPLGFVSGRFTIDERVLGASRDGLVLSNLAVIAPDSGQTLRPAPTHLVDREPRPVPDHDLTGAALYLPDLKAFLWFSADVTLLERKGGLFLIDVASGHKDLVLPVSATLAGGYWRVEEMAREPGARHVLLAQRFAIRGPGGVAIVLFDAERREVAYEERFGEGSSCEDPQVVLGPGGLFGLAYLDATAGERVLVRYELREK